MSLTPEEIKELEELEKEEKDRKVAAAAAAKRQHLEALRMAKRLSAKHGAPGRDFVVLETTLGNIAVRRPVDVEIDTIDESSERDALEKFAAAVVIEPAATEVQRLMAENSGLMGALVKHSMGLLKVVKEDEAKK